MAIAITGASGQLGSLVIEALLEKGVDPRDIVAVARTPEKVAASGVVVRTADYEDADSLDQALAGVDKLLLISGNEMGRRLLQHRNIIEAARKAGVGYVAYTSLINADSSSLSIADEHRGTERALAEAGIPYTVLRNGWYTENFTAGVSEHVSSGFILGGAGAGRIAAATRRDFAEAAAALLLAPAPGRVFELGGSGFTLAEFARAVGEVSGSPVDYRDLTPDALLSALRESGVPESVAKWRVATDDCIARGALDTDSTDLAELLGRPTTALTDAIAVGLSANTSSPRRA
tara:strand:- start:1421 stop:2290 length:870 start_codon:yes stop_codon:yes gene_type:complete